MIYREMERLKSINICLTKIRKEDHYEKFS